MLVRHVPPRDPSVGSPFERAMTRRVPTRRADGRTFLGNPKLQAQCRFMRMANV